MKPITQFISEYYFNKNLNKSHYIINEGIIDWLKDFWNWLSGDENKKEFNVWDNDYDESNKKKYINDFDSNAIKVQPAENTEMIKKIINKEKPTNNKKSIFSKTESVISNFGESSANINWILFMFKSEELTECAGIIGYLSESSIIKNAIEIVSIDINKIYSSVIDLSFIRDTIIKLAKSNKVENIVFRDSERGIALKLKNNYSFDLEEAENKKGYYIHTL